MNFGICGLFLLPFWFMFNGSSWKLVQQKKLEEAKQLTVGKKKSARLIDVSTEVIPNLSFLPIYILCICSLVVILVVYMQDLWNFCIDVIWICWEVIKSFFPFYWLIYCFLASSFCIWISWIFVACVSGENCEVFA